MTQLRDCTSTEGPVTMLRGHLRGLACCTCLYFYTALLHAAPISSAHCQDNLSSLCGGARPRSSSIQRSDPCQPQIYWFASVVPGSSVPWRGSWRQVYLSTGWQRQTGKCPRNAFPESTQAPQCPPHTLTRLHH